MKEAQLLKLRNYDISMKTFILLENFVTVFYIVVFKV